MDALTIAIIGLSNILCFYIGARVGQAVSKGEKIETPVINPVKAFREKQARIETEKSIVDTILDNIDNYDGTPYGQKDVPRG